VRTRYAGRSGHRGALSIAGPISGQAGVPEDLTVGMGSKTGAERAGVTPGRPGPPTWLEAGWLACVLRSVVVTSQARRGRSVIACWQRNWQLTQPPATARRRRVDMKAAKASAAATAAPAVAAVSATARAAVAKKWLTGLANTSHATARMTASQLAGRA